MRTSECLLLSFKRNVVVALCFALSLRLHNKNPKRGNEVEKDVMERIFGDYGF